MIRTAPTRDEDVLAAQRAKRAKAEADKKAAEENARGIEERQKSLWVDELSGMRNKLEAQNLINAGKEKEAFIEGELVKLRKDHGGDLSFSQTSEAVGLAGKLFDAGTEKDKAGERKKLADMLADMKLKLDLQTKINAGKEKEAFITEELARLKPDNRDLTSGEAAQISGMAGQLYDAKAKAPRDEKTGERMDVDRLTKLGLYNFNFGGMRDTKSLDIERNSLLKRIAEKVGIPVERTMLQ